MGRWIKPGSDAQLFIHLARSAKTGQMDIDGGRNYLPQTLVDELTTFIPDFRPKVLKLTGLKGGNITEERERGEAIRTVEEFVRDLWAVHKRKIRRERLSPVVITYYQLNQEGEVPAYLRQEEWLEIADRIVKGDAEAVLAGHPASANPNAADLQAVLDIATAEAEDVPVADRALDEAQKEIEPERAEANRLVDEIDRHLRFNLHNETRPSLQRILRSYGYIFEPEAGETDNAFSLVIGSGDGTTTSFSATIPQTPIVAGTLSVNDGNELFTDNGDRTLTGSEGGSGSIDYVTGALSVNFSTAPLNEVAISVSGEVSG